MGRGVPWGVAWGMGSIKGLARDRPQSLFYIVWFFFRRPVGCWRGRPGPPFITVPDMALTQKNIFLYNNL